MVGQAFDAYGCGENGSPGLLSSHSGNLVPEGKLNALALCLPGTHPAGTKIGPTRMKVARSGRAVWVRIDLHLGLPRTSRLTPPGLTDDTCGLPGCKAGA